jgi:uncharacterized delta-60 repeat protein
MNAPLHNSTLCQKIFIAFIVSFLLNIAQGFSQAGTLDSSFGVNGKVTTGFNYGRAEASSIITQGDGKILVAGSIATGFSSGGNYWDFALARYKPTGNLDSSFGSNGKVITDFYNLSDEANCIAIDFKGNIIVAGSTMISPESESHFALIRYKQKGE